jgi:hypothetical protein
MNPVTIHEVRESRRTSDTGNGADLLMRELQLLEHFEESGENGEVTATRTPGRMVGREIFFGKLFRFSGSRHDRRTLD